MTQVKVHGHPGRIHAEREAFAAVGVRIQLGPCSWLSYRQLSLNEAEEIERSELDLAAPVQGKRAAHRWIQNHRSRGVFDRSRIHGATLVPHTVLDLVMATTTKVTVTLDDTQLVLVRRLVAQRKAESVSGFVKHAVSMALADLAGWGALLGAALEDTGGGLSAKERAWADSVLKPAKAKCVRRRRTR